VSEKKYLSAKLDEEGLYEEFVEYKEERGHESKSSAIRQLIRAGLEAERREAPELTEFEELMYRVASVIIGLNFLLLPLALSGLISPRVATLSGVFYIIVGFSLALATDRGLFRFGEAKADATGVDGEVSN
jgi:predicted cobalt transporter CbtA